MHRVFYVASLRNYIFYIQYLVLCFCFAFNPFLANLPMLYLLVFSGGKEWEHRYELVKDI